MVYREDLLYYTLGAFCLPLLPLLYWQGKRIVKRVPKLPEADGSMGRTEGSKDVSISILGIGESTMAGVGVANQKEGFIGAFSQELNQKTYKTVNWEVVAKSGIKLKDVSERLLPKIKLQKPDLILLAMGGNDAFALRSPKQWEQDSIKLLAALRQKFGANTTILLTNMPPIQYFPAFTFLIKMIIGSLVNLYRDKWVRILSTNKNTYFNSEVIHMDTWKNRYHIEINRTLLFSDGVHPSKLTYQIWGKDMVSFLAKRKPDFF